MPNMDKVNGLLNWKRERNMKGWQKKPDHTDQALISSSGGRIRPYVTRMFGQA